MKQEIKYEPINVKYANVAAELVLSAYLEERMAVPFLPFESEMLMDLQKTIENLFKQGNGIVAMYGNEFVGFLAGFEIDEFFGECRGIYCPLYGHGVKKEYRQRVYQQLYKEASKRWVQNSYLTHAITLFAHDRESIDTWFWQGFGMRCVDAIREVVPIHVSHSSTHVRKADLSDVSALVEIHQEHIQYYQTAPTFMPVWEEDPVQDLTKWLIKPDHHLWVAYQDERPLGYMRIQPDAETFVSEHQSVMNITGAYVIEQARKTGTGAMLLGEIQQWLLNNGYPLCGVDFEAINTTGSNFWLKFFTPYTYSLVRRIDERIVSPKFSHISS